MGSFKHPYAFDPLDLEIIDRVYEAAWAQIEARESHRDTGGDPEHQRQLREPFLLLREWGRLSSTRFMSGLCRRLVCRK